MQSLRKSLCKGISSRKCTGNPSGHPFVKVFPCPRRGELVFLEKLPKGYKQIPRAKRAGKIEPFSESTEEIQTNPAREARRGF